MKITNKTKLRTLLRRIAKIPEDIPDKDKGDWIVFAENGDWLWYGSDHRRSNYYSCVVGEIADRIRGYKNAASVSYDKAITHVFKQLEEEIAGYYANKKGGGK